MIAAGPAVKNILLIDYNYYVLWQAGVILAAVAGDQAAAAEEMLGALAEAKPVVAEAGVLLLEERVDQVEAGEVQEVAAVGAEAVEGGDRVEAPRVCRAQEAGTTFNFHSQPRELPTLFKTYSGVLMASLSLVARGMAR